MATILEQYTMKQKKTRQYLRTIRLHGFNRKTLRPATSMQRECISSLWYAYRQ